MPSHHAPCRPRDQPALTIIATRRTAHLSVRLRASAHYDDEAVMPQVGGKKTNGTESLTQRYRIARHDRLRPPRPGSPPRLLGRSRTGPFRPPLVPFENRV